MLELRVRVRVGVRVRVRVRDEMSGSRLNLPKTIGETVGLKLQFNANYHILAGSFNFVYVVTPRAV